MRHAKPFLLFVFLSGCSSWLDLGSNKSDATDPNASGNVTQGLCGKDSSAKVTLVTEPNVRISGLTHDDEFVYYQTMPSDGSAATVVKRVPLAGGVPEELARSGRTEGIIVAGDFIYWSAPRDDLSAYDLVRLSRKRGSSPEVMTHATDWPSG